MNSLNKAILIGHVGKDPDIRTLGEDKKVANFTLATSERWRDRDGEMREITDWHNIVAWGNLALIIESYVHKGDLLVIEGKITNRSWEDKDGNRRFTTEINTTNLIMLTPRKLDRIMGGNDDRPPSGAGFHPVKKDHSEELPLETEASDDLPF